jgi:hypothetical protein
MKAIARVLLSSVFTVAAGLALAVPNAPAPAKAQPPAAQPVAAPPAASTDTKAEPILDKAKTCQQYEGQYLAYYDLVFVVKKCQRHLLSDEEVYALTRKNIRPLEVPDIARIVQTIPRGGNWSNEEEQRKAENPCSAYDHLYVTDGLEIYWVDKCELKMFPDWASYESHRGNLGKNPPHLRYLDEKQLLKFKRGKPLASVIDGEYRELDQPIATIPLAQACKGKLNQFVSYLDMVFYIEATKAGCVRRIVDAEAFTRSRGRETYALQELNSSEVITIPLGSPYLLK